MVSSIGSGGGFNLSAMKQMQQDMFKEMDSNGDSKVDKNEMNAFKESQKSGGMKGGPSVDEMFTNSDSNGDGGITLQEMQDSMARVAQQMMQGQGSGMGGNNPMAGMKQNFDDLGSALESGNIDDAKKALNKLKENAPKQAGSNPEIDRLSNALESGDLKAAQDAYAKIEDRMSQMPQGMSLSGTGQGQTASSEDEMIKTLLEALSKSDDKDSAAEAAKKKQAANAESKSSSNSSSAMHVLEEAIRSYTNWSGNSYGQSSSSSTLQSASVYG
jgi:EF-hand domain pair